MTADREQVIPALKKYLDMTNWRWACQPGGLFPRFVCTAWSAKSNSSTAAARGVLANRTIQVLKSLAPAPTIRSWPACRSRVSQGGVLPVLD